MAQTCSHTGMMDFTVIFRLHSCSIGKQYGVYLLLIVHVRHDEKNYNTDITLKNNNQQNLLIQTCLDSIFTLVLVIKQQK